jgi:hypothetical protein
MPRSGTCRGSARAPWDENPIAAEAGGLTVDTGQHAFLGCCSAYRGLLAKLGMTDHAQLQDGFDVTVLLWPNESRFPPPRRR